MTFLVILLAVALNTSLLYIHLVRPNNKRRKQMMPFAVKPIAHRGLHNKKAGIPENSITAFRHAIDKGYGIELNTRLTSDGKLVVFHDDNLKRMCGIDKKVEDCTFEEIRTYNLLNTTETIPSLASVLNIIHGAVPVIVDIKPIDRWKKIAIRTASILDKYEGEYCIESSHPYILAWFKNNRPDILRGQLSCDMFRSHIKMGIIRKFLLSSLLMNHYSRPDFISYNHKHLDQWSYKLCRKYFKPVSALWTVKNEEEMYKADKEVEGSIIIFEGFDPGTK